ncbi:unnamed protein product [Thelazia callipaeda]|uniref:Mitochondrial carrier protein n=1 Tax=Thelazia callipaeda TaxID=103827 RepID=A0A0N5D8T9_THECL|nr:unnamed protein product [Thelazia callipaeda]
MKVCSFLENRLFILAAHSLGFFLSLNYILCIAGVITGYPFDTVKVRQQIEGQSIPRCCVSIVRNEGYMGFFKGMSSPLMSITAINAIAFGVYENTLKFFNHEHSLLASFFAGNVAGAAQCGICIPSELVKTRMQLQKNGMYTSSWDCAKKMIRRGGLLSVYKGTWITIARDCSGYGTWYVTYEFCTRKLSKDGTPSSLPSWQLLIAGGLAGVTSWLVNYPLDVIKTRFQADDNIHSYRKVCHAIMKTCGIRGFFAGISATIIRAFPSNAFTFLGMEWSYRLARMMIDWHKSQISNE